MCCTCLRSRDSFGTWTFCSGVRDKPVPRAVSCWRMVGWLQYSRCSCCRRRTGSWLVGNHLWRCSRIQATYCRAAVQHETPESWAHLLVCWGARAAVGTAQCGCGCLPSILASSCGTDWAGACYMTHSLTCTRQLQLLAPRFVLVGAVLCLWPKPPARLWRRCHGVGFATMNHAMQTAVSVCLFSSMARCNAVAACCHTPRWAGASHHGSSMCHRQCLGRVSCCVAVSIVSCCCGAAFGALCTAIQPAMLAWCMHVCSSCCLFIEASSSPEVQVG